MEIQNKKICCLFAKINHDRFWKFGKDRLWFKNPPKEPEIKTSFLRIAQVYLMALASSITGLLPTNLCLETCYQDLAVF